MKVTNYLDSAVGKTLFLKALPMFAGIFAHITYNLVDTFYVARLGTQELAAMSFGFPVTMIIINIMMGVGTAISSLVSRQIGSGLQSEAQQTSSQGFLFTLLLSALLTAAGLASIHPLFRLLGADASIMGLVEEYISSWYAGMVFMNLSLVAGSLFRAKGNVAFPSMILFGGAVLNAIFDPILIFGWGPFPALGIRGAALTTVFGNGLSAAILCMRLYKEGDITLRRVLCTFKIKIHAGISKIALPTALANSLVPMSTAYTNWLLVPYGNAAVAGNAIATRIETIPFIAIFALASVLAPFIGQNWGAKNFDRIRQGIKKSFIFSYLLGAVCAVILMKWKSPITALFDKNGEAAATTWAYFRLIPLTYGLLGTVFLTTNAMNAIGRPFVGNILSACRLVLFYIPLATLLNSLFAVEGIFLSRIAANTIVGVLSTLLARRTFFTSRPQLESV